MDTNYEMVAPYPSLNYPCTDDFPEISPNAASIFKSDILKLKDIWSKCKAALNANEAKEEGIKTGCCYKFYGDSKGEHCQGVGAVGTLLGFGSMIGSLLCLPGCCCAAPTSLSQGFLFFGIAPAIGCLPVAFNPCAKSVDKDLKNCNLHKDTYEIGLRKIDEAVKLLNSIGELCFHWESVNKAPSNNISQLFKAFFDVQEHEKLNGIHANNLDIFHLMNDIYKTHAQEWGNITSTPDVNFIQAWTAYNQSYQLDFLKDDQNQAQIASQVERKVENAIMHIANMREPVVNIFY
jgi:hypothetical protein